MHFNRFQLPNLGLTNAHAIKDDAGIGGEDLDALSSGGNRHGDSDEVILHGDRADGILLTQIRIALRHGDVLDRSTVKADVHPQVEARPEGEIRKELENERRGGGGRWRGEGVG